MIDKDFEMFLLKQSKSTEKPPLITQAVSFMEYFADDRQNELWNAEGTLLKRISRYKEFCKQPCKEGMIRKYFDYEIAEELEISLVKWHTNMDSLLRHFTYPFKPEWIAFFNIKDAQKGTNF